MLVSARRAHQRARAGRARPQGRVQARAGRPARARVHARAHRRRSSSRSTSDITLDRRRNHTIDVLVDRLIVKPGIERRLVGFDRARAEARRRHRRHQHARGRRSAVLAPDGVPDVRHQHSGDVAARVLVQLAARRVPGLPGARRGLRLRSRAHRAGRHACRSPPARSCRGRRATSGLIAEMLAGLQRTFGIDPAMPFGKLPKKLRDIVLFGAPGSRRPAGHESTGEAAKAARQGSVRRGLRGRRFPTCGAGSTKARGPIRKRSSRTARCSRARLRRRAAAAGEPRGPRQGPAARRDTSDLPISEALPLVETLELTEREQLDRRARRARDPRSAALSERRRRRLPHARPRRRDALGRRRPAHPAGDADWLAAHRRALRARRAVDRPAPARQPPAARRRSASSAISATPCSSSSTTRRRFAPPTT